MKTLRKLGKEFKKLHIFRGLWGEWQNVTYKKVFLEGRGANFGRGGGGKWDGKSGEALSGLFLNITRKNRKKTSSLS